MLRKEEFYKNQMINGLIYISGEEDPFSGVLVYRYPNGDVKETETYVYGLKEGVNEKCYENGQ